ncbi:MAG: redox-sensing transcriptional repressor Rex [Clostridia bacterium]|nr:redox-sensing transcriptional repressor Rex [Clostridia bacterium]
MKSTQKRSPKKQNHVVSSAVIHRLPRYFRYLRMLMREGKTRVSSGELSELMNVTASQIRQDLNCFGGFGQQGYGYNVSFLYAKICELLGVGAGFSAIVVGAGDLGRAISRSDMFEKRGVDVISLFDVDKALIGRTINGVAIRDMADLESFCRDNRVDMAVLTVPKAKSEEVAARLAACGVRSIWNFTGNELSSLDIPVENVHLGDSLMILEYRLNQADEETERRTLS